MWAKGKRADFHLMRADFLHLSQNEVDEIIESKKKRAAGLDFVLFCVWKTFFWIARRNFSILFICYIENGVIYYICNAMYLLFRSKNTTRFYHQFDNKVIAGTHYY